MLKYNWWNLCKVSRTRSWSMLWGSWLCVHHLLLQKQFGKASLSSHIPKAMWPAGWRNNPISLGHWRLISPSKVWQFTWHTCYERQQLWSTQPIQPCNPNPLRRACSANVSTSHNHTPVDGFKASHLDLILAGPTNLLLFQNWMVTNKHPELLTILIPQWSSHWNHLASDKPHSQEEHKCNQTVHDYQWYLQHQPSAGLPNP